MLEHIIRTYGYLAIFIGTFFEGETILILAGFLAHSGYLTLPGVILAAFMGSLSADQILFHLGRRYGNAILARSPLWKMRAEKALRLIEKVRTPLMIIFRFLYGLRTITPYTLGMTKVSSGLFLVYNIIGALAWSAAFAGGGYLFGTALEVMLGNIKRYERSILLSIIIAGISLWIAYKLRCRWEAKACKYHQTKESV
jgi:membrane protein DedA with SNARE-associated domain